MKPLSMLLAAAVLAGASIGPRVAPTPPLAPPTPAPVASPAPSLPTLQVFGPGGTEATVQSLVDGARRRVLVEAYALDDPAVLAALRRVAQRGVDVRVMLDPRGLNSAATVAGLQGTGVRTRTPNPSFLTHLDMIVVDTAAIAVLTSFPTAAALGPAGRAYAVIDRDRLDVLQGASLFFDDWLRRPVRLFGHNLVVLPDSAGTIAAQIDAAGTRVELYTSGLSDPAVLSALRAARSRGVVARVLTQKSSNSALLRTIAPIGRVRFLDDGRGTVLVIDRRTVLLGSMDLAAGTLKNNRELGVVVAGQAVAAFVDTSFFTSFARGQTLLPPPIVLPKRSRTVTRGNLAVTITPPSLVRVGGEGLIVVSTAANARVRVAITYPAGSTVATPSGGGQTDKRGTFVYRWIVPGGIKPGQALARVTVQSGARTLAYTVSFAVAR